jgi:hypothetical protein
MLAQEQEWHLTFISSFSATPGRPVQQSAIKLSAYCFVENISEAGNRHPERM